MMKRQMLYLAICDLRKIDQRLKVSERNTGISVAPSKIAPRPYFLP